MRERGAGADPLQSRRNENKSSRPSPALIRSPSDRLHIALAVALAAVTLVIIAFPLSRSQAGTEATGSTPVVAVSDGLSAALSSQAQSLVAALAQVGPTPAASGTAVSRSLGDLPGGALVPRPLLVTAAYVLLQGALAGPEGQSGLVIELQHPVRFTLHESGFPSTVFSTRPTVGGALAALGAGYSRHDLVFPGPDMPLTAGLHVFVERATALTLSVGGEGPAPVYTHARTVAELLAERGVELAEGDSVTPTPSMRLSDGLAVSVTLVRGVTEVEDTPIPFDIIYRDDHSLLVGEYRLLQRGQDGYVHREYAVVYRDGREVSRRLLSETVVESRDRIIAQGTGVVAAAVAAPAPQGSPQCARTLSVWATWYTAASAGGSGTTATGTPVRKGTVAVDPRVIPLGTRMHIPGYGYGVAEDTGGAIIGNIVDLGYGLNDVKDWRSGWVEICILSA